MLIFTSRLQSAKRVCESPNATADQMLDALAPLKRALEAFQARKNTPEFAGLENRISIFEKEYERLNDQAVGKALEEDRAHLASPQTGTATTSGANLYETVENWGSAK